MKRTIFATIAVLGLAASPTLAMAQSSTIQLQVPNASEMVVEYLPNGNILLRHVDNTSRRTFSERQISGSNSYDMQGLGSN